MTIRINRVYTRSGDDGRTGLVGGERVSKYAKRVAVYGGFDEINSFVGVAKEEITPETSELTVVLEELQQELFDLGSEVATPPGSEYAGMQRCAAEDVTRLELLCDRFSAGLEELTSFLLPGGSRLAAQLHVIRTISRRVEREVVELMDEEKSANRNFNIFVLQYLNRFSDLFFILARWTLQKQGCVAPLWIQRKDRTTK